MDDIESEKVSSSDLAASNATYITLDHPPIETKVVEQVVPSIEVESLVLPGATEMRINGDFFVSPRD